MASVTPDGGHPYNLTGGQILRPGESGEQFVTPDSGQPRNLTGGQILRPGVVKPEQIVRPAESWQDRYDQRIAELRAPPGLDEEDPELCIGGQNADSGLTAADDTIPGGGGFSTKKNDESDEEKDPPQYEWVEQSRKTKKIRVENPDDSDQYVVVERIESMQMKAPDPEPFNGIVHTWIFKNKPLGSNERAV